MNDSDKIKTLKDAIQKMLNGINFALDENFSRKVISNRLIECRKEAIKVLTDGSDVSTARPFGYSKESIDYDQRN